MLLSLIPGSGVDNRVRRPEHRSQVSENRSSGRIRLLPASSSSCSAEQNGNARPALSPSLLRLRFHPGWNRPPFRSVYLCSTNALTKLSAQPQQTMSPAKTGAPTARDSPDRRPCFGKPIFRRPAKGRVRHCPRISRSPRPGLVRPERIPNLPRPRYFENVLLLPTGRILDGEEPPGFPPERLGFSEPRRAR
jgi:hypothetical protein